MRKITLVKEPIVGVCRICTKEKLLEYHQDRGWTDILLQPFYKIDKEWKRGSLNICKDCAVVEGL